MSVRVLVLVLSVDREPWRSIERDGQRATWAAPSPLDEVAPVRFYRGRTRGATRMALGAATRLLRLLGSERRSTVASGVRDRLVRRAGARYCGGRARTVGDIIETDVPETYAMVSTKLFATLTHVLRTEEFDYLFRTNSSTYVDRRRLVEQAGTRPRTGYWGGFPGQHDGVPFTSGAGTLLSRDVVLRAVEQQWDWAAIDDVALGSALHAAGFQPEPLGRPVITGAHEVVDPGPEVFMWRCKGVDRRDDVQTMTTLHELLRSTD